MKGERQMRSPLGVRPFNFPVLLLLASVGILFEPARAQDKIDLKKIESDFWSAKDTDFSVIQNRAFPKEGRFYTNLATGILVNDPFTTGNIQRLALGYYFSERWGIELGHELVNAQDSKSTQYLKSKNAFPNYNFLNSYTYVSASWVPFYAKMSLLDRKILYYDMQLNFGVGQKAYTAYIRDEPGLSFQSFGYHLDVVQNFFFTRHWSFRLDLRNQWASQNFYYSDGSQKKQKESSSLVNDTSLLIGLTYFF
jgi:outer membrane beta-barrel protein